MSLLFMALLQAAGAGVPIDFDLARLPARDRLAFRQRCEIGASATDILVCAVRPERKPVPNVWRDDPDDTPDDARVTRGTGMAALTPVGACGMFAGQRDCSKADMAHFGYGRGRDPVTFVGKLAGKLLGHE
jgi:hypothetical protein